MKLIIPDKFKERYLSIVDDKEKFLDILEKPLKKSFRVNTLKVSIKEIESRFKNYGIKITQLPYYKEAFISEAHNIGSSLEHFLGHIYIQEITSMLPVLAVKDEIPNAAHILDACAAPGSKTTQIAAMKENKGIIVANDADYRRVKALKFNIERIGAMNTILTNRDLRNFPEMEFDIVFLDAPCSSEGTTRKSLETLTIWSENCIKRLSKLQKQLILKAFSLVKPGGILVYSTCTYAPEENEEVIDFLLSKTSAKLEKINLDIKTMPGITEWKDQKFNNEVKKAVRVWPHLNDTDGFFIARIRK